MTLDIQRPRFDPPVYSSLRTFFERVVSAHAEQVVLRRTGAQDG